MISILLINPPLTVPIGGRRVVAPPLGLAYLGAVLLEGHFDVRILDCLAEGSIREEPAEPGFVRIGLTRDEIEMRIANDPPAIAAISCVSTDQLGNVHMVAECVKNLRTRRLIDVTVVVGGPGVAGDPHEIMQDFNIDYVIHGEGEIPIFQLCTALYERYGWENVPGVVYRNNEAGITVNPVTDVVQDVDMIPMPARHLLNMQRYTYGPSYYGNALSPHTSIVLSRGCYSQCSHCMVPRMFGGTFRKRSTTLIFDELEILKNEYNVREIEFIGDNLFHDRAWAHDWMNQIIDTGLEIKWSPMSGQSLYNFDIETASLAVQSGMRSVFLDVRSGDPDVYADFYKRPGALEKARELVQYLKRHHVWVGGIFSMGAPGENLDSMGATMRFAFSLGLHEIEFQVMTPFPGTPMWDDCVENKYFEPVPTPGDLLLDRGYVTTSAFTAQNALWMRDWSRTREQIRQLLRHPDRLTAGFVRTSISTVIHPIGTLGMILRYVALGFGTPFPPPRAPRMHRKKRAEKEIEF